MVRAGGSLARGGAAGQRPSRVPVPVLILTPGLAVTMFMFGSVLLVLVIACANVANLILVRTRRGEPTAFSRSLRTAVRRLDPDLPVHWVQTPETWIDQGRSTAGFLASLFSMR